MDFSLITIHTTLSTPSTCDLNVINADVPSWSISPCCFNNNLKYEKKTYVKPCIHFSYFVLDSFDYLTTNRPLLHVKLISTGTPTIFSVCIQKHMETGISESPVKDSEWETCLHSHIYHIKPCKYIHLSTCT